MPAVAPARRLAEPAHTHSDVLGKFTSHRRYNSPICKNLAMDADTVDIAKAIGNCALTLGVDVTQVPERPAEAQLRASHVCNKRVCPFCEWRRSRVWRSRFFEGLPKFAEDFPTHKPLFLTLTVKNCRIEDLRSTIADMHRAWKRMTLLSMFPTKHWFRRTEVVLQGGRNSELGAVMVHPHIHVLLMVPSGYFSHGYVKQTEWQKSWMMSARLDYSPVIDIRRGKLSSSSGGASSADTTGAALEVSKYATKATDLIAMGSNLGEYHRQVKGLRLSASSASLKPYIADTPIDTSELVDKETADAEVIARGKALWFDDIEEYLFSDIQ